MSRQPRPIPVPWRQRIADFRYTGLAPMVTTAAVVVVIVLLGLRVSRIEYLPHSAAGPATRHAIGSPLSPKAPSLPLRSTPRTAVSVEGGTRSTAGIPALPTIVLPVGGLGDQRAECRSEGPSRASGPWWTLAGDDLARWPEPSPGVAEAEPRYDVPVLSVAEWPVDPPELVVATTGSDERFPPPGPEVDAVSH